MFIPIQGDLLRGAQAEDTYALLLYNIQYKYTVNNISFKASNISLFRTNAVTARAWFWFVSESQWRCLAYIQVWNAENVLKW